MDFPVTWAVTCSDEFFDDALIAGVHSTPLRKQEAYIACSIVAELRKSLG
jgi:hypothetical protein